MRRVLSFTLNPERFMLRIGKFGRLTNLSPPKTLNKFRRLQAHLIFAFSQSVKETEIIRGRMVDFEEIFFFANSTVNVSSLGHLQ